METFVKNTVIDRWMKLSETPEAIASTDDLSRFFGDPKKHQEQLSDDRARRFINAVFWHKSLPAAADWTPFPRLGIYEMLCQHGRVLDCLWFPILEEHFDFINAQPDCAISASVEVLTYLAGRVEFSRLKQHPFFDDRLPDGLDGSEREPTRLFFLPWDSIIVAADVVIPNPENCLILENFSIA